MNVIFLTRFNLNDINCCSGTEYHVYHKLKEKHTIEILKNENLELKRKMEYKK